MKKKLFVIIGVILILIIIGISYLRGAHKSPYRNTVMRCVTFFKGRPQIELTNIAI